MHSFAKEYNADVIVQQVAAQIEFCNSQISLNLDLT
jgi:hypothetical protein